MSARAARRIVITSGGAAAARAGTGTCRSGSGRPANSRRHGMAISLAHCADRFTRALSVAMPVFAYIWR